MEIPRSSSNYWVPKNYGSGFYDGLFYLITDKLDGQLLVERPEKSNNSKVILDALPSIIGFVERIQKLKLSDAGSPIGSGMTNCQEHFLKKTIIWFQDIPENIREKYQIIELLNFVESSCGRLQRRPRHGDFTPWHLMVLRNGKLGLIDGEHAMGNGVENYDLGYFLQRVYSVLENPALARKILDLLIKKGYKKERLKTILAARAIGGFLDETLKEKPNYEMALSFKKFIELL